MRSIWIELPATDVERARRFYAAVFGHDPGEVLDGGGRTIVIIPGEPTVSLNQTDGFEPGTAGPLPYFDVEGSVGAAVDRVVAAGGRVAEALNERPGYGYFALVHDTEGNHLYLHGTVA